MLPQCACARNVASTFNLKETQVAKCALPLPSHFNCHATPTHPSGRRALLTLSSSNFRNKKIKDENSSFPWLTDRHKTGGWMKRGGGVGGGQIERWIWNPVFLPCVWKLDTVSGYGQDFERHPAKVHGNPAPWKDRQAAPPSFNPTRQGGLGNSRGCEVLLGSRVIDVNQLVGDSQRDTRNNVSF